MKKLRIVLSILMAAILFVGLSLTAVGFSVWLTRDEDAPFFAPAMQEAIFSAALAGEDPALIAQLEEIEAFKAAQLRYSDMLAAWRYDGASAWTGLTQEEASTIAKQLLRQTLSTQDPSIDDHADYEQTLEALSVPLQSALQDVFPDFELVLHGALRTRMDTAAALLRGTTAAGGLITSALCAGFLLLLLPEFRDKMRAYAAACFAAASCTFIISLGFFTDIFRRMPNSALGLLSDVPVLCPALMCIFATVYVALAARCLLKGRQLEPAQEAQEATIEKKPSKKAEKIEKAAKSAPKEKPPSGNSAWGIFWFFLFLNCVSSNRSSNSTSNRPLR